MLLIILVILATLIYFGVKNPEFGKKMSVTILAITVFVLIFFGTCIAALPTGELALIIALVVATFATIAAISYFRKPSGNELEPKYNKLNPAEEAFDKNYGKNKEDKD